jgi:hypothetical protein
MIETPTVTTLLALDNYCNDGGDAAGKVRGMVGYPRGAGGGGGGGSDDAGSGYNSSSSGGNSHGKHDGGGGGSKKAKGGARHRRPHDRRGDREPR